MFGSALLFFESRQKQKQIFKKKKRKKKKKSKSWSPHPTYAIDQSSAYAAAAAERRITRLISLPTWFVDVVELTSKLVEQAGACC
jgi:hypothetical protein